MNKGKLATQLDQLREYLKDLSYYKTCVNQKVIVETIEKVIAVLQTIDERLDKLEKNV